MLTDKNIDRHCRYRLVWHGLRGYKVNEISVLMYYGFEVGKDNSPLDSALWRYLGQWNPLDYAERLAGKEAEYRANRWHHGEHR